MKAEDIAWQKLVAASRNTQDDRSTEAPYGFSTRVAALAFSQENQAVGTLFERWSWRALAVAGVFAAVTAVSSYSTAKPTVVDELISEEASMAALLD